MLKGFKDFIFRGNVIDLAVGVVMGAAFGNVVTALVKDILTPFIGAIVKVPNFSNLYFSINNSRFMYGDFINVLVSFVLVAVAVYFAVILPINTVIAKLKKGEESAPTTKKCGECLSDVPLAASRCAFCGQPLR